MAQQVKVLAVHACSLCSLSGTHTMVWKEKNNTTKLASDLHGHIDHMHPHPHRLINAIFKKRELGISSLQDKKNTSVKCLLTLELLSHITKTTYVQTQPSEIYHKTYLFGWADKDGHTVEPDTELLPR